MIPFLLWSELLHPPSYPSAPLGQPFRLPLSQGSCTRLWDSWTSAGWPIFEPEDGLNTISPIYRKSPPNPKKLLASKNPPFRRIPFKGFSDLSNPPRKKCDLSFMGHSCVAHTQETLAPKSLMPSYINPTHVFMTRRPCSVTEPRRDLRLHERNMHRHWARPGEVHLRLQYPPQHYDHTDQRDQHHGHRRGVANAPCEREMFAASDWFNLLLLYSPPQHFRWKIYREHELRLGLIPRISLVFWSDGFIGVLVPKVNNKILCVTDAGKASTIAPFHRHKGAHPGCVGYPVHSLQSPTAPMWQPSTKRMLRTPSTRPPPPASAFRATTPTWEARGPAFIWDHSLYSEETSPLPPDLCNFQSFLWLNTTGTTIVLFCKRDRGWCSCETTQETCAQPGAVNQMVKSCFHSKLHCFIFFAHRKISISLRTKERTGEDTEQDPELLYFRCYFLYFKHRISSFPATSSLG